MPANPITVAYYRMSTLKQDDSIDRQRATVQAYAKRHGYVITAEYIDEGLAGDLVEERPAFQRLLKDSVAGKVNIILADALDRLSRLDIWEAGVVYHPLRKAGVAVETVAQGRIDWDDFAGSIVAALHQQKGTAEAKELARRSLGGLLKAAAAGKSTGGKPAYGYRREYETVEQPGQPPKLRPLGYILDPERAAVVRLIFDMYANQGKSLKDICRELYRQGIASPAGAARWSRQMVRLVIDNRRYTGDGCYGCRSVGKYYRHTGNGEIAVVPLGKRRVSEQRPEAQWQVRADSHPPIIDRSVWERARDRRAAKRHPSSCPNTENPYLFSGLCVCAHCGSRLIGRNFKGGRFYRCNLYDSAGKGSCLGYAIAEPKLLGMVTGAVERLLASEANIDAVVREAEALASAAEASAPKDAAKRAKRLAQLERQIAGGVEKLSILDADLVPDMQASIRQWKNERAQLEKSAAQAQEAASARSHIAGLKDTLREVAKDVRQALRSEEPALVRTALRELTSSIELEFSARREGKRNTYTFASGWLNIRPQEGLDLSSLLTAPGSACLAEHRRLA